MDLRFQASIGQLDKNHRVSQARQEIARIMTVLGEKAKAEGLSEEPANVAKRAKAAVARSSTRKPRAK